MAHRIESWNKWETSFLQIRDVISTHYILQHTATHCIWMCLSFLQLRDLISTHYILQHTATHCIWMHLSFLQTRDRISIHYILQHTVTHCNTLQHTATHCNTLQHTATHCNTLHMNWSLKCSMTHFYVLWLREVRTMTWELTFENFWKTFCRVFMVILRQLNRDLTLKGSLEGM